MSSTRTSAGGEFHQERFCSSPEFEGDAINGLAAAKRISIITDRSTRELLWFIQSRSLSKGGLQKLCDELAEFFPQRIGTPTLRVISTERRFVKKAEIDHLRREFELGTDSRRLERCTTDEAGHPAGGMEGRFLPAARAR